ncbi:hypothetical protein ACFFGR_19540 [Arthrobacter liuii]|uniref:Uncharacterized protein n=1 Tax=Arthrobacter liuii TaxID=1476996 RepID=A0ABQ2AGI4_9MICC|nr:hypothetical protein [Arthrobacter liuii]GGH91021.1 hypothetical protein GCM10007170_06190 [Arthrobacter liuii]
MGSMTRGLVDGGRVGVVRKFARGLRRQGPTLLMYKAAAGWDPCTGLGSPDGTALLHALASGRSPAGAEGIS